MVIWEAKWGDGDDCRLRAQQAEGLACRKYKRGNKVSRREAGGWPHKNEMLYATPLSWGSGCREKK